MFNNMYIIRMFKHMVEKKKASVPSLLTNGKN